MKYILANIRTDSIIKKELWNGSQYITIFEISDSKATPEEYFDGTDEILFSLIISSIPDGDYYTNSKLYKIEGLNNPKVIEIKEIDYPKFSIKIKHRLYDKRKIESFIFEGAQ